MSDHAQPVEHAVTIAEPSLLTRTTKTLLSETSDDDSPPSSDSSSSGQRGRRRASAVASEDVRRRRRKIFVALAFLPFAVASVALGFAAMGRLRGEDGGASNLDGGGESSSATDGEAGEAPGVPADAYTSTTTTPTPGPTTGWPTPSPDAGKLQGGSPATTATAKTRAPSPSLVGDMPSTASSDVLSSWADEMTSSPTPAAPAYTSGDALEEIIHGNLRSTTSPTPAKATTASPTTSSPTTSSPTTSSPTTSSPTTANPTTASPTTANPTTSSPTTAEPTTASPTTSNPTTASPTKRPTDPPVPSNALVDAGNDGEPGDAFPLGPCEGDCDDDDDCEESLVCFHRDKEEAVPGCFGEGVAGTDYCSVRPPDYLYAPPNKSPLGMCEGDCDADDDCEGSLRCFHRDATEAVPGCSGEGTFETDYCADLPANYLTTPNQRPLGLCEGDCDSDDECKGDLVCEQRDGFAEVPGCVGTGLKDSDYCREAPALVPPATSPDSCVRAGDACPDDKKLCCSGWCEKDKESGEKVCGMDWEDTHGYLRATAAPTVAPTWSCKRPGELCPEDKKLCCSGKCDKDKESGNKVCAATLEQAWAPDAKPGDACLDKGQPCTDKKLCCSGWCMKAEDAKDKRKEERKEDDGEVCG